MDFSPQPYRKLVWCRYFDTLTGEDVLHLAGTSQEAVPPCSQALAKEPPALSHSVPAGHDPAADPLPTSNFQRGGASAREKLKKKKG